MGCDLRIRGERSLNCGVRQGRAKTRPSAKKGSRGAAAPATAGDRCLSTPPSSNLNSQCKGTLPECNRKRADSHKEFQIATAHRQRRNRPNATYASGFSGVWAISTGSTGDASQPVMIVTFEPRGASDPPCGLVPFTVAFEPALLTVTAKPAA